MSGHFRQTAITLLIVCAFWCAVAAEASAGVIVPPVPAGVFGPGLGAGTATVETPFSNNDNPVDLSPNIVTIEKRFDRADYIDMVFEVRNSGGTTEYSVFDAVRNNTGATWRDFHFELGFFTGAAFVPSRDFDFLDFDQPYPPDPMPTSSHFTNLMLGADPDALWWSDGFVFPMQEAKFWLPIDVPDSNAAMPDGALIRDGQGNVVGYRFTLREIPTIPEPSSVALFGIAGLALAWYGWRRKKGV